MDVRKTSEAQNARSYKCALKETTIEIRIRNEHLQIKFILVLQIFECSKIKVYVLDALNSTTELLIPVYHIFF